MKGIDLRVEPGEVFGLLGPNGAGKSTTIGMLTTTVIPTAGSAHLAGHDVRTEPIPARSVSAAVFQDPVVDRSLSGRRNLHIHARLWGVPPPIAGRRITDTIVAFGLEAFVDRPVAGYSGGQRRRLEIARSLLSEPRVLFLDEPTVGLDPRVRFELLDLIAGLRGRNGMTVVLTTHYLDEAERLCDRVAIMHAGTIVALDTPDGLLAGVGTEVVELRVAGNSSSALATIRSAGLAPEGTFVVGGTITIPVRDATARSIANQLLELPLETTAVSTRRPTLDDVYLCLTGDELAA